MFKKRKKVSENNGPDGTMPLLEHLRELRVRVMHAVYFFAAVFILCYAFRSELVDIIKQPIEVPLAKYAGQVDFDDKSNAGESAGKLNCTCQEQISETAPGAIPNPVDGSDDAEAVGESAADQGISFDPMQLIGNLILTPQPAPSTPAVSAADSPGSERTLSCYCEKAQVNKKSPLVFISITEVFLSELKAALFAALFFSAPFFFIQIGIFILPALYSKEKNIFLLFTIGGYLFFIIGALFGYFVVFPFGFDFFLGLSKPGEIVPYISVENYLSFALTMLFCFGLVFELPLVLFVLVRTGVATPFFFLKNIKYAVVLIVIVSAILTPPDPISLILMAVPLILLYCFGILLSFLGYRRKPDETKDAEA